MLKEHFEKYKRIFNGLKELFNDNKAELKDIRDLIGPGMGDFLDKNGKEDNKIDYQNLLDEDTVGYFDITQNGLFSGLVNPATKWFKIEPASPALKDDYEALLYCNEVERRYKMLFDNSSFYPAIHKIFGEAPRFGIASMIVEESIKEICNFNNFTIGEAFYGINAEGEYDKLATISYFDAEKMIEKFGHEKVDSSVNDAFERADFTTKFEVCSLIAPNLYREHGKNDLLNKPFICLDWQAGKNILRVNGYDENPLAVLPWYRKNQRTVWPFSPGRLLLGSVRQIQNSTKNMIYNEDLANMPPVNVHNSVGEASILPGGQNITDGDPAKAVTPVFKVDNRLEVSQNRLNTIKARARSISLADIMLIFSQQRNINITATEVNAVITEQMLMLGAIYLNAKRTLDKIFARVFSIGLRRGFWPEPPQSMRSANLQVEYVSAIALAQKATEIKTMAQLIEFVQNLSALQNDNIDTDFMARRAAAALGADPKCLISEEKRNAARMELAKQAQQAQELAQSSALADNAQKLSKANIAPDNALGAIANAMAENYGGGE